MANKMKNKNLIIVLVLLIAIFVLVKIFHTLRMNNTMGRGLLEKIDTSKVTEIFLFPISENGNQIRFTKQANNWYAEKGKIKTEVDPNSLHSLLSEIINLKIDQLLSKGKDKWKDFHVDDSSSSKIKIYEGNKLKLEMRIGKFNYQPPKNQYSQYYGGGISGNTSVRIGNDNNVYAVSGYLLYTVSMPFNNWRNQNLIKLNKSEVTKLTFKYPADSSFVIEKKDTLWYIDNILLNKKNVESYLNKISLKTNSEFIDDSLPTASACYQLEVEGKNMTTLSLTATKKNDNEFILNSSQNPKNYFISKRNGLIAEIFVTKEEFLMTAKKK